MAWHTQRRSRFRNFAPDSARKRAAGRNYSGFGFQTASSARNAAVRNTTRFAGETRPVPRLPTPDLRHRRNRYAPHAPAADRLVLGDLSVCHGQTRHFCRPAESYAEHLLWVGVASFARKMARLCSRGCRLLKMSPAARSSRSLTKLLRRAQKLNASATEATAT